MSDNFIHSGLASDPNNWSEGRLPNSSDSPPNTGILSAGTTMLMLGPTPALNLQAEDNSKLVMVGQQTATVGVLSGAVDIDAVGDNTLNWNGGVIAPAPLGTSDISFTGTFNLNAGVDEGGAAVKGAGTLNADVSLFGNGGRPDNGRLPRSSSTRAFLRPRPSPLS